MASTTDKQDALAGVHKYKLKPPTYHGDYGTFEEWKYKFQAYIGLRNGEHERLMRQTERATARITDIDIEGAAGTQEEATLWKQLSQEMKYILTGVTTGGAAIVCRQHQHETGYEIYRQLNNRYSIPVGTRRMGYLTKLLEPTLDPNNFKESFSHCGFELIKFESDNSKTLPDQVKVAMLLNETTGPLEQHLQLLAGTSQTYTAIRGAIMEYYRATTAFSRMQATQAPSSSGTSYSKGVAPTKRKGYKGGSESGGLIPYIGALPKGYGRGKGYGKWTERKEGRGHRKGCKGMSKGKIPSGQGYGHIGKGWQQQKGKGKSKHKSKQGVNICYRCGREGH